MKIKNHLVLISSQAVPNITPILDERFRPEHVIMLVYEGMLSFSESLAQIYKPRGVKVSRWMISDPWDVEHIRNRVLELLSDVEDEDIALNVTGGTKPMSIAAYEVFRAFDKAIFYVHPEKDRLIWMHPDLPSVDLADRIKLKEYLLAYGATKVEEIHKGGVNASLRDLTTELIDNIKLYEPALSSLNYFAATAENSRFESADIGREMQGNHRFWDLLDLFEQANLLRHQGRHLIFPNEDARFIVNGGWLEFYVYACCLDLKKSSGIQDLSRSVEVSRKQGSHTVLNEMDVAFLKDNRLYLLECKTKRFSGHSKKHSEGAEVLYKLDSIRDLLGGLQARAMLVSIKKLKKHHLSRARELGIEICCFEDIKFLQEKLQLWLKH